MSFIASMVTTAIEAGLISAGIGTAAAGTAGAAAGTAGLLGAGATSTLAGALGGGLTGAGIGALGSAVTGGDVGEGAMLGGLTGGALGGLGGLGSSLNATEAATVGTTGQTLSGAAGTPVEGIQAVSSPLASTAAPGSANAAFNAVSSPVTQVANAAAPMQSPIGNAGILAQQGAAQAMAPNIFSNQGALSGIGDLAQGYANMGTLGKTGVALGTGLAANMGMNALNTPDTTPTTPSQKSQFSYNGPNYSYNPASFEPYDITKNRNMFPIYQPSYAAGGLTDVDSYASDAQNVPQDMQVPNVRDVADPSGYLGNSIQAYAEGGIAGLAVGGKLLSGAGDGVSDDLVAHIDGKQPARLASGEFVVPARVVSELGNGSTDAGAKRLNEMVKRVNAGRAKTLKGKSYAKDTQAYKHLPA